MILNSNGRSLARLRVLHMERQDVVNILEGRLCIQCYDNEINEDFVESIINAIECDDLEIDDLIPSSHYKDNYLITLGIDANDDDAVPDDEAAEETLLAERRE
jgi:hypothetical protein